ncbi:protein MTSS 1 isoform X11 [Homo sapiens]|uniref:protein MTSS 1 isoform X11 n=1 Tax=Homo sapiens TaxID=9606 RepID=UPI000387D4C0|nr:protein MTSS 1 isoform X11 [Homo sapiens]|eukprot:XP_005251170.1 metastasis suppressor protein 1 isoform X11 [Homo sapiens]
MEAVIEKECSALGGLFQTIISDMKGSYPVWEDFINKAGKLQSQLRTTVVAAAAFLDAFQKVADMATNTRGGTREIGSALTRMCMRHRSIEAKLRQFSSALIDCLINPLQEQMEEWKKVANQLDKDHAKEYKKARQEIKKKSSDTLKLQKKAKKVDTLGRGDIQPQLDSALQDVNDKYLLLEETEKQAVRKALIEERGRFCTFISMLRPVIEEEISMLGEITHLQTISEDLKSLTMDPHKLPSSSEQVILDLKGSDYSWSYQTPPSSPSTTMSRKSSVCSSLNSVNSSDSRSSGSHSHSPSSHYRYRSSNLAQQAPVRLSSVSSHDSGFISQDAFQSKSPSPMPPEAPNQDWAKPGPYDQPLVNTLQRRKEKREPDPNGGGPTTASGPPAAAEEAQRPRSMTVSAATRVMLLFSVAGWGHLSLAGDHILASNWGAKAALQLEGPGLHSLTSCSTAKSLGKKPCVGMREAELSRVRVGPKQVNSPLAPQTCSAHGGRTGVLLSPPPKATCVFLSSNLQPGEEMEACEELALALSRGLQLDTQRSSRDSLQCSSGYSTQTTTPCCSEDTIPSQVSDYDYFSVSGDQEADQQEFDKSSTIPRNSDISQSYRRMFQAKRPASTAGLPTTLGPAMVTPGVATIRRTPSTKPSVRRGTIGAGPIPIKTPVIPVKTPTVPDLPGVLPAPPDGPEERGEHSPESPSVGEGPQGVTSMPSSMWSGQASVNPPLPGPKPSIPEEHRQAIPESEAEDQEREPPSATVSPGQIPESDPADLSPRDTPQGEDMLNAIRRGVKLKKTTTNDRSAPRFS